MHGINPVSIYYGILFELLFEQKSFIFWPTEKIGLILKINADFLLKFQKGPKFYILFKNKTKCLNSFQLQLQY